MRRPPRKLNHSPFSFSNVGYALTQGVGISVILLLGYWVLSNTQEMSENQERVIVFISLVVGIVLLVMANKDPSLSSSKGAHKKDALFLWLAVLVAGMLIVITTIPAANRILHLHLPTPADWGFAAVMVTLIFIWLEALRRVWPRYSGARSST
jgi:Ca2+-transporting ATPase